MSKEPRPSVPPASANSKKQIMWPWCLLVESFKNASFTVVASQKLTSVLAVVHFVSLFWRAGSELGKAWKRSCSLSGIALSLPRVWDGYLLGSDEEPLVAFRRKDQSMLNVLRYTGESHLKTVLLKMPLVRPKRNYSRPVLV